MSDVSDTIKQRGAVYGEFADNASISEDLIERMMSAPGWSRLSSDKKKALRTIQDKVSRILNGDPEYKDNWHDIAGYAKLAEDRCVNDDPNQYPLTPLMGVSISNLHTVSADGKVCLTCGGKSEEGVIVHRSTCNALKGDL